MPGVLRTSRVTVELVDNNRTEKGWQKDRQKDTQRHSYS